MYIATDERHAMWFLLIVLLAAGPGINRVTVLNTFSTYEACQPERNRIGFEMAESYPRENNFLIVWSFERRPLESRCVRWFIRKRHGTLVIPPSPTPSPLREKKKGRDVRDGIFLRG